MPYPADRDVLTRDELRTLWERLAQDHGTPERYELTEHGELVVSALPTNRHQLVVREVAQQLERQFGGVAVPSLSVLTQSGVRVPDVAWLPEDRKDEPLAQDPLERCPPLVVAVLSPGNQPFEVNHKVKAYLAAGATEVLVVGLKGQLSFRRSDGAHGASALGVALALPPGLFAH